MIPIIDDKNIKKVLEEMEANGLVVKTLEYRDGRLQPVWELTPLGKAPARGDEGSS
jgi:DNA-binding HxlR family transcriptional regulator